MANSLPHLLATLLLPLLALFPVPMSSSKSPSPSSLPNILLLITDDQDVELGSLHFMPKTLRLLSQRGVQFRNAFVSTPICCPSRSSIFTGLYAHNHRVMTNNQNCSGPEWRELHEKATFAVLLAKAGYRTGFFGKYLNEYDGTWIPPGWQHWAAIVRNSRYYNYSQNVNGKLEWHGFEYEKDYLTDLITQQSLLFMRQSLLDSPKRPFLAVLSFPAPHGPEDPAPQFSHLFDGVDTHRTKSWNYAPNPDKQWLLQRTGKMEPVHVAFTDQVQRRRLQTLRSVDDAVEKIVHSLRSLNQLHNTFLLYTSDHGYHLGQFGLVKGKAMPYEFDIRVPFLLRGPGVPRGKTVNQIVANIDIGPTILEMAGLEPPETMDGQSILGLLEANENEGEGEKLDWRETILIERGKMPKLAQLNERLKKQRERLSKEARLNRECGNQKYQGGCKLASQHWQCSREGGRWRMEKCQKRRCKCGGRRRRRQADGKEEDEEEVEEFLRELDQVEVLDSGQWFQGIFEGPSKGEWEGKGDRRRRQIESVLGNEGCSPGNARFCQRFLNESLDGNEERRRRRLTSRIEALRRRLSVFKHLRNGRANPENSTESCECPGGGRKWHGWKRRHPLLGKMLASDLRRQRSSSSAFARQNNSRDFAGCHIAQMNCFQHSPQHWRTPPLWPSQFGHFCFCQNANNNSYWCLRTVNGTHNFLFCEFVTEEVGFYDLLKDPHQLLNSVHELPENVLEQLSAQLRLLKSCRGRAQCEHFSSQKWNGPLGKWPKEIAN